MTEKRVKITNAELLSLLASRTDEVGYCYEWNAGINSAGHPVMRYQGCYPVARRVAYCLHSGLTLADIKGLTVWATCGSRRCISPHCWSIGTRGQMLSAMAADGRMKGNPARAAQVTRMRRSKSNLVGGIDGARQIRERVAAGERRADLAREYGVCESSVDGIVNGRTWREHVAGSSVFNQLFKVSA